MKRGTQQKGCQACCDSVYDTDALLVRTDVSADEAVRFLTGRANCLYSLPQRGNLVWRKTCEWIIGSSLRGLQLLDLSQGIAGPYCTEILLQNGAAVTKVEPPGGGWARGLGLAQEGMSAIGIAYNIGKRSICIDAAKKEGRLLIRRLAARADVIVESFRPGVMDRFGLS